MSRDIRDELVMKNVRALPGSGSELDILLKVPKYMGQVEVKLPKVGLSSSEFGIKSTSVVDGFMSIYNALADPMESDCILDIAGNEFKISKTMLKILKALFLYQVNANEDFSVAVFGVIKSLMVSITTGSEFKCIPVDENPLSILVSDRLGNKVSSMLGGA